MAPSSEFSKYISFAKLPQIFACMVALSIPFSFRITTLLLILFGLSVLVDGFRRSTRPSRRAILLILPWTLYYLIFAAGWFYSDNKGASLSDLETKFSLLVLPPLIIFYFRMEPRHLSQVLLGFIIGLLAAFFIALLRAITDYSITKSIDGFLYHSLVSFSDVNAAYFSWYVLLGLLTIMFWPLPLKRVFKGLSFTLLLIFLLLLSGRSMQMFFALIAVPAYLFFLKGKQRISKSSFYVTGSAYLLIIIFFIVNPSWLNPRFSELKRSEIDLAFRERYNHYDYDFSNIGNRLLFWRIAWENYRESNALIGAGNGDVTTLQNQRMHDLGIQNVNNEDNRSSFYNANVHNMYLQTLLATGIIGLLLLLFLLVIPFFMNIFPLELRALWYLFICSAFLIMIQESVFQTQAGVVFFTFFSALFFKMNQYTTKGAELRHNRDLQL